MRSSFACLFAILFAAPAARADLCLFMSQQAIEDEVRRFEDEFNALQKTDGVLDKISSYEGCTRALKAKLTERFSTLHNQILPKLKFPLSDEACDLLVALEDRTAAWLGAYRQARKSSMFSTSPDVCRGMELKVEHRDSCTHETYLPPITMAQQSAVADAQQAANSVGDNPPPKPAKKTSQGSAGKQKPKLKSPATTAGAPNGGAKDPGSQASTPATPPPTPGPALTLGTGASGGSGGSGGADGPGPGKGPAQQGRKQEALWWTKRADGAPPPPKPDGDPTGMRALLDKDDQAHGITRGGGVISAAREAASDSSDSPLTGTVTFNVTVDASGHVTDVTGGGREWEQVRKRLLALLKNKPAMRIPAGARGMRVTISIEAAMRLPSGAREGQSVQPYVAPGAVGLRFDLSDIGSHATRQVHTTGYSEKVEY